MFFCFSPKVINLELNPRAKNVKLVADNVVTEEWDSVETIHNVISQLNSLISHVKCALRILRVNYAVVTAIL